MEMIKKITGAVLIGALAASLTACSPSANSSDKGGAKGLISSADAASVSEGKRGEEGDFMLKDIHGKEYRLSDFKGKKVFIKFWASWCSVCMATIGETNRLAGENNDFVVLSIVAPGFGGEMKKDDFIKWYNGLEYKNILVLLDEGGEVTKAYGVRFYPTGALIDSEGKVRAVVPGHIPSDTLKEKMATLP